MSSKGLFSVVLACCITANNSNQFSLSERESLIYDDAEKLPSEYHTLPISLSESYADDEFIRLPLVALRRRHKKHSTDWLDMDEARLTIVSNLPHKSEFLAQADACWKCPLVSIAEIGRNKNHTVIMDTRLDMTLVITDTVNTTLCSRHVHLLEYGDYVLWVSEADPKSGEDGCALYIYNSPPDPYIPIYVALGIFCSLIIVWSFVKFLYRSGLFNRLIQCFGRDGTINTDAESPTYQRLNEENVATNVPDEPKESKPPKKQRLRSLDTFRGFSLIIMIFVNYGGGGYWFFNHSSWNGLTVADLVFPWFIFIMGTSIVLAFGSMLQKNVSRKQLILKTIKRTVILFLLGLIISNGGVNLSTVRIMGVLQRIALTYFIVATIHSLFALANDPYKDRKWAPIRDVLGYWPEWLIISALVALYLLLTFLLPVPNCPTGYLGPGGLHDDGQHWNCTGGAGGYIDRVIFGASHIYQHPTCETLYKSEIPYDPESFLGTLTAALICFMGLQAGKIFLLYQDWRQIVKRLFIWCFVTGLVAGILCKFSMNDGWIPVNKNLWSLSFVLSLSSMAFFLLALCYLAVDVCHIWSGVPFIYPGMNSIIVYMCHELMSSSFPIQFDVANTHASQLAMNLWGSTVWVFFAAYLYYKNTFVAI